MNVPLRPMTTGELLDRTFSLYRNHFVLFFGIAMVPPAMSLLFQLATIGFQAYAGSATGFEIGAPAAAATVAVAVVYVVIYYAGYALAQGATVMAVSDVHLGNRTTIGASYGRLRGRIGRILTVWLAVAIRVFGGALALMVVAATVGGMSAVAASVIGGVASVILVSIIAIAAAVGAALLAVTLWVRYSLAVPACVVEDLPARASLKRSIFLSRGSRGRILTVYTLAIVLTWVISGVLTLPLYVLLLQNQNSVLYQVLLQVMSFLAGSLAGPIATIAMALVYFDERVRKEAYDLQVMMASLDSPSPSATAASNSQV